MTFIFFHRFKFELQAVSFGRENTSAERFNHSPVHQYWLYMEVT